MIAHKWYTLGIFFKSLGVAGPLGPPVNNRWLSFLFYNLNLLKLWINVKTKDNAPFTISFKFKRKINFYWSSVSIGKFSSCRLTWRQQKLNLKKKVRSCSPLTICLLLSILNSKSHLNTSDAQIHQRLLMSNSRYRKSAHLASIFS